MRNSLEGLRCPPTPGLGHEVLVGADPGEPPHAHGPDQIRGEWLRRIALHELAVLATR